MSTAVIIETLVVDLLVHRQPLPSLFPQSIWRPSLTHEIERLEAPAMVRAALFVWNDDLERAHQLVQPVDSPEAAYWHAILHRREQDFSNSLYWYGKVGKHSIHKQMLDYYPHWSPKGFLEACESGQHLQRLGAPLEAVQADEMGLLLSHCLCAEDSHPLMRTIPGFHSAIVDSLGCQPPRGN